MANLNRNEGKPGELTPESRRWERSRSIVASPLGRLLLGLCLLQFVLLGWLTLKSSQPPHAAAAPHAVVRSSSAGANPDPVFRGNAGPWGVLEYVRITIEPPDEFVPVDDRTFEKTRWVFGGCTRERVAGLFSACSLTPAQRAELANPAIWGEETNAVVVIPSPGLILSLNESARTQIYTALAADGRNDFQMWPYTFRKGGFDAWFARSGLSHPTIALVKRLIYLRGSSLCFSDLPEAFSQIPTLAERRRLVKTLSRNATILMKLRITPDSDIPALTAYWKGSWRAKDIEPLLRSLTEVPGGATIDVAQLLPPFARKQLNTYPRQDPSTPAIDCYWTAMNFFRDPPDDRYYSPAAWQSELDANYTVVAQPTYGDAILFMRGDNLPIHAAVYIADDVVFTKNGGNDRQPWMLMKWDDLLARYPQNDPIRPVIFHRKQPLP
jgi:hypothetical protein